MAVDPKLNRLAEALRESLLNMSATTGGASLQANVPSVVPEQQRTIETEEGSSEGGGGKQFFADAILSLAQGKNPIFGALALGIKRRREAKEEALEQIEQEKLNRQGAAVLSGQPITLSGSGQVVPRSSATGAPLQRGVTGKVRVGVEGVENIQLTPETAANFANRKFMNNVFNKGMTIEQAEVAVLKSGLVLDPNVIRAVGERKFNIARDEAQRVINATHPDLPLGNRIALAVDLAVRTVGSKYIPRGLLTALINQGIKLSPEVQSAVFRMFGTITPSQQQLIEADELVKAEAVEQVGREAFARESGRIGAGLQDAPGEKTLAGALAEKQAAGRARGELGVPQRAPAGERGEERKFLALGSIMQRVSGTFNFKGIGPIRGMSLVNFFRSVSGLSNVPEQEVRATIFQLSNAITRIQSGVAVNPSELERILEEAPTVNDTTDEFFGKLRAGLLNVKGIADAFIATALANNVIIPPELKGAPEQIIQLLQSLPGGGLTAAAAESAIRSAVDDAGNVDPQILRQILRERGLDDSKVKFDEIKPLSELITK